MVFPFKERKRPPLKTVPTPPSDGLFIPQCPVPRGFAEPIGYFCVWFTQAELSLNYLIYLLFGLTDEEQDLIQSQFESVATRLSLLEALIRNRAPESAKMDLLQYKADFSAMNTIRNELMHNPWQQWSSETGACLKKHFPRNDKTTAILDDFTVESITNYGHACHDLISRRVALVEKHKLVDVFE